MKIINVILSGGVGSRLWPLSRKKNPKQYLKIFNGENLFRKTILRNRIACNSFIVVGNKDNYKLSRNELNSVGINSFDEIIEAVPRNTTAAIAFAALSSEKDDILFVTPSDHLIEPNNDYYLALEQAISLAKNNYLVTFGLKPTRPETGFGYIEFEGNNVLSFREKPSYEDAKGFVSADKFLWNSGMFCFKSETFLNELEFLEPYLYERVIQAWNKVKKGYLELHTSLQIPSISVDVAIMEKSKKVKVVQSSFNWSDMGSFESLYEYLDKCGYPKDGNGNMVIGANVHVEFSGVKDTLFIQTKDAFLVLKKENSQSIKEIYKKLEFENPRLI